MGFKSVWLGKSNFELKFYNIMEKYDAPNIAFVKMNGIFPNKEYELEDWQVNDLIRNVIAYLKSKINFSLEEKKENARKLKEIEKLKELIKKE